MYNANDQKMYFYVGTYTSMSWSRGEKGKGIYHVEFDPSNGSMSCLSVTSGETNPSFMTFDSSCSYLYVVNEVEPVTQNAFGTLSSFKVDKGTGALTRIGSVSSKGLSPCFICLDKENKFAFITNYSSGSAAIFPIKDDHSLGECIQLVQHSGQGVDRTRQECAHTHSLVLDKNQKHLIVADLGLDKLMVYELSIKDAQPLMSYVNCADVGAGDGPRHMTFDASGKYLYLMSEMGSRVYVFEYDCETGALTKKQDISTLPSGAEPGNCCADIHISNDGKYLYGSNRGHDSIALFEINPYNGLLTFVFAHPSGGKTPRNFAIDPSGRFLIAANQDSDKLVSFSIDKQTGRLTQASELEIPSPVCVKFLMP